MQIPPLFHTLGARPLSIAITLLALMACSNPALGQATPAAAGAGDVPVYLDEIPMGGLRYFITDTGQGYVSNGLAFRKFQSRAQVDQHRKSEHPVHLVKEQALLKKFPAPTELIKEVKRERRLVGGPGKVETARVLVPRGWKLHWFWTESPPPGGPQALQRKTPSGYSEFQENSRDGKGVEAVGVKTDNAPRVLTVVLEKSETIETKRSRR